MLKHTHLYPKLTFTLVIHLVTFLLLEDWALFYYLHSNAVPYSPLFFWTLQPLLTFSSKNNYSRHPKWVYLIILFCIVTNHCKDSLFSPTRKHSLGLRSCKEMGTHSSILAWKSQGWRSLVGYSPWGRKESDTIEWLHFHFHHHQKNQIIGLYTVKEIRATRDICAFALILFLCINKQQVFKHIFSQIDKYVFHGS